MITRAAEFPLTFAVAPEDAALEEVGYRVALILKYRCGQDVSYELLLKPSPEFASTHGDLFQPVKAEEVFQVQSDPSATAFVVGDKLYAAPSTCGNVERSFGVPKAWKTLEEILLTDEPSEDEIVTEDEDTEEEEEVEDSEDA
jgi:hypothetical protein